jgi:hypothetical protein
VESRVVEGGWCFYLHLWGVRDNVASPVLEKLAAAALWDIGRYIRQCAGEPPADVIKPAQFRLSFRIERDDVHSMSRAKPVSKYFFSTGPWWA